ncbi:MAG: CRISPR-associated protein Cas4 [Clostridia bacterium]|nr:CRISPR-associated protein Cas4 [Clostridia bacterium]
MSRDTELLPISALNQYSYCPRRCWLMYVAGEFMPNEYTVEGELIHTRVHQGMNTKRDDVVQFRRVLVYSQRLKLIGYADVVEEKAGELYPVEYKRGPQGKWHNDQLQLCAQGLCLEEMTKHTIPRGYVYYALSRRREVVLFTTELRRQVESTVALVRAVFGAARAPEPSVGPRCHGCSLYPVCLPTETARLKAISVEEFL